ncbi:MAG: hypothetical protein HY528_04965 [Chloroflexi bacterium]|nr:hypothetical protein [Chloroflexota bacterium]
MWFGVRVAIILAEKKVAVARFEARLSHNVSEAWIVRLLAIGLALVAIRLLIASF